MFDIKPIRNHSDHAGLIGCIQLVPSWILSGHESILVVDIGGTNILEPASSSFDARRSEDLFSAAVGHFELWRHREDEPEREDAVQRLIDMLLGLHQARGERRSESSALHRHRLPWA